MVPNPKVTAVAADAGQTGTLWGKSKGIEKYDYLEEEFLISGTSPAYTSRMVVHRHRDAAKFSGTVFMEWYNVTGGIDIAPLWAISREYFVREGHVHVGVSAQEVGATALKSYDAQRYATINHPGDTAADAIFSQAAVAVRSQGELILGPCMPVKTMIALGQSQSAAMLGSYITNTHPKAQVYEGYMLHSSPFGGTPTAPNVPVFVIATMNEGDGSLVEGRNLIEWEVAGASHNDAYLTARGNEEQGASSGVSLKCASPLNDFPSFWAYNAALDWLNRWVRMGAMPPRAEALKAGTSGTQNDQHGNILGGLRLPDIDVPIATHTSANAPADLLDIISFLGCGLGGSVSPLSKEQLKQLYPTHEDYVQKYTQAADKALKGGYLLQADYDSAIAKAKASPIP